jgi:membrane-associated protease RseP (regulator of RpoE activity)
MENVEILEDRISRYFNIKNFSTDPERPYFILEDYDRDRFTQLARELEEIGYVPWVDEFEGNYYLRLGESLPRKKSRYHIQIILFIITIATTISAGYLFGGSIIDGIAFSVAIMAIIGTHELAHYFAARKYGVEATLPYFIPAPTLIGTFGAVINVKSPIPNKDALFDLGASGPLAGLIVTIPVLFIGIFLSTVEPIKAGTIIFNPPLLMSIIAYFAAPVAPEGYMISIHPVAFAGWVGIVVTMLNLMPVSFLDGGHISRSIFKQKFHKLISFAGVLVTIVLGWIPMAILMAIIMVMSREHPGAMDNVGKLSRNRKILSIVLVVVLLLCLAPAPSYI